MLEPDHLATAYDRELKQGRRVMNGIEFDRRNRRTAYYLYKNHPASRYTYHGSYASAEFGRSSLIGEYIRVPAVDIAHVYLKRRPGQVRGVPWLAPGHVPPSELRRVRGRHPRETEDRRHAHGDVH